MEQEHKSSTPRSGENRSRSASGSQSRSGGSSSGGRSAPRRSRRRSVGARISGALLYVLFVIGISAVLATVGWIWAGDVLALNKAEHTASITLPDTIFTSTEVEVKTTDADGVETVSKKTVEVADMDYVADLLAENGLIEYKFLFKLFARFTGAAEELSAGTYELNTNMDYRALLINLGRSSATRAVVEVTIPEGYTLDQIFALLESRGVNTVAELENMAATWDYKFSWLQGKVPLGDYHRLEGYLFPDTYQFYTGEDPKYVLNKMLVNFNSKMRDFMSSIEEQGRTLHEVVTVASMIEKETDGEDQKNIASVIYNRLKNDGGGTMGYLQIDATLAYINGGNVPTEADKSIDSPYNTYLYPGLPAGPISNPGMAALYAAVSPAETGYYYYALGDDNVHHYFKTYQGFLDFLASQERYGR